MVKDLRILLIAQFLSAFADNAVLFTAVAMVRHADNAAWYVPALQASFIIAYVLLAAWVGPFADRRPKAQVLVLANWVKAAGVLLLFAQVEPLLAYALVGVGAVMYSPAKYGIVPELVKHEGLVAANSWLEGATIAAILLGMVAGAALADHSVSLALSVILVIYLASSLLALLIRRIAPRETEAGPALKRFRHSARQIWRSRRGRFALLGASLFWSVAAVLRVVLIAWAPLVLLLDSTADIATLTVFIALGIALGAVLAGRLISLEQVWRLPFVAALVGIAIVLLAFSDSLLLARFALFAVGVAGGLFIVPLNALLQELGHLGLGSGAAVAVQRFAENLGMLLATVGYALAAWLGAAPVSSLVVLGLGMLLGSYILLGMSKPASGME